MLLIGSVHSFLFFALLFPNYLNILLRVGSDSAYLWLQLAHVNRNQNIYYQTFPKPEHHHGFLSLFKEPVTIQIFKSLKNKSLTYSWAPILQWRRVLSLH